MACIDDVVEQLFDLLADNNKSLTELHTLIGNRLSIDHHRSVREEDGDDDDDDEDDHDEDEVQNVNL